MICARQLSRMEERSAFNILTGKPIGKVDLGVDWITILEQSLNKKWAKKKKKKERKKERKKRYLIDSLR